MKLEGFRDMPCLKDFVAGMRRWGQGDGRLIDVAGVDSEAYLYKHIAYCFEFLSATLRLSFNGDAEAIFTKIDVLWHEIKGVARR